MEFRYSLPFVFVALVPIGAMLGGAWTFLPALATLLSLTLLGAIIGDERSRTILPVEPSARWLPRIYILLQLLVTAWAAISIASKARFPEMVGLIISTGTTAGIFGFLAAHEMIHSQDKRERALGLIFLGSVFYMHFRIAHLFGHHRRAATADDPTTARLGESFYAFLVRSIWGQLHDSWTFECRRLQRSGRTAFDLQNRVLKYVALEVTAVIGIALVSSRALILVLGSAAVAICLLEGFNYIAHYGLVRRKFAGGRFEPLQPKHSWNSREWMNNSALLNMGCHSDHHRRPSRSFEELKPTQAGTELPSGYATAVILALVPPLWRALMDPRARAAMRG